MGLEEDATRQSNALNSYLSLLEEEEDEDEEEEEDPPPILWLTQTITSQDSYTCEDAKLKEKIHPSSIHLSIHPSSIPGYGVTMFCCALFQNMSMLSQPY